MKNNNAADNKQDRYSSFTEAAAKYVDAITKAYAAENAFSEAMKATNQDRYSRFTQASNPVAYAAKQAKIEADDAAHVALMEMRAAGESVNAF